MGPLEAKLILYMNKRGFITSKEETELRAMATDGIPREIAADRFLAVVKLNDFAAYFNDADRLQYG